MLPDIVNYIPDPKNGRPVAGGKIYFLVAGYIAPDRDSDLDVSKIAEVTANALPVAQPIYTSQGGVPVVGSRVNQPDLLVADDCERVAVYDKCGKLLYQVGYSGTGAINTIVEQVKEQALQALTLLGYIYKDPDTFTTGSTLNGPNEALRRASDGEYFRRVQGPYPYTVTAGTDPTLDPLYVAVGSASLADKLGAADSTVLVGGTEAGKIGASVGYLTPEQFFIAGEVDATGMIMRMAAQITDGTRCEFQAAKYTISYAGTGLPAFSNAPYGISVIELTSLANVTLKGNNTTIECVNHDIAANGGFLFFRGTALKSPRISGFTFDMSFTGVNTSASYYPFVGAIVLIDTATGSHTQDELCGDVVISDCRFKLYHPFGSFATSGAPFAGDPNNGYKMFSIFASGDNLATTRATQNNKISIDDCTCLTGHNGYGFWVWAYNNVQFNRPTAEDWVLKESNNAGVTIGGALPFIRYHQFYNKGVQVNDIQFRAKPCSERIGAFAGSARAIGFNTNLNAAGLDGGDMIINGGSITGGNGDLATSQVDVLIFCNAYGRLVLDGGLLIDGLPDTVNALSGTGVLYSPESNGGTGYGEVHIGDVKFGKNLSYYDNIQFLNGATTDADRRCKLLTISDVCSLSQLQYFLDMDGGSAAASKGVAELRMGDILVDGAYNTVFNSASTNSRAFRLAGVATDSISGNNVKVKNKYYEFLTTSVNAGTRFTIDSYESTGTTARVLGSKLPVLSVWVTGTPEGVQVAAVSSVAKRLDGGTATTFYVKEPGTISTGWVAK